MGLDSVELIIDFEKYFSINITDAEAENLITVQEVVDSVARHKGITDNDTKIKFNIFNKIKSFFIQNGIADTSLLITDKIFDFLNPDDQSLWTELSKNLELKIPYPYRGTEGILKKVFSIITWRPNYDWRTITIDEFITALAANNYESIINPKEIKNKYEILIAVIALTTDKTGVDIYEVQPQKRFVDDFGID